MSDLDFSGYLADRPTVPLLGIPSKKHPAGRTYLMPSPSAKFALQLRRIMQLWGERGTERAPTRAELNELNALLTDEDGKQVELETRLLGDAFAEMVEDGITGDDLQKVVQVVMIKYGVGEPAAQAMLTSPGEAPARPNRAERRATVKRTAGPRSVKASTATATKTKPRASSGSSTSAKPQGARKAV